MDRLDELALFVAILDTGSLAGAGRRLHRSPPVVTRALAALEDRLGARLFERTTRRLSLTRAGRRLEARARALVSDYREVFRDRSAAVSGELRVTAPIVFGRRHLAPIAASFLDAYPDVSVELLLEDRPMNLIEEGVDVALRIGRLREAGLVARRVGEVRRVLVASPGYLARRGSPRTTEELARHDVIFSSGRSGRMDWVFPEGARRRAVRLAPRLIVNDMDALLLVVRAGRGIGRPLSYQVAEDLSAGTLVRLLPEAEPPPLPVQLVLPGKRVAPKTRAFVEHAARLLAALAPLRG